MTVRGGGIAIVMAVLTVGIAGCSTLDVRGSTRSSALVEGNQQYGLGQAPQQDPRYEKQPHYGGQDQPNYSVHARPTQHSDHRHGAGYGYASVPVERSRTARYDEPAAPDDLQNRSVKYYPRSSPSLPETASAPRTDWSASGDGRYAQTPVASQGTSQLRERRVATLPASQSQQTTRFGSTAGQAMSGKQDQSNPTYRKFGWARWIGPSWRGHTTTSGEIFQPERLTGSHATLPLPSFVYVTNRTNGRTVLIRVNDRVPHSDAQAIIVSQRAAELLDFVKAGRVMVDIQYAGPASPLPNAKHEEAFLRQQPWFKRDLVQDGRAVGAPIGPTDMSVGQRYPTPTYPRWDGTQRQR